MVVREAGAVTVRGEGHVMIVQFEDAMLLVCNVEEEGAGSRKRQGNGLSLGASQREPAPMLLPDFPSPDLEDYEGGLF